MKLYTFASEYTKKLLKLLDKHDVPATFFILGESLADPAHQRIARRIAESHTIASHSWSHLDYTKLSGWQVEEDLKKTSDAIEAAVGFRPKYFRPPYGYATRLTHDVHL